MRAVPAQRWSHLATGDPAPPGGSIASRHLETRVRPQIPLRRGQPGQGPRSVQTAVGPKPASRPQPRDGGWGPWAWEPCLSWVGPDTMPPCCWHLGCGVAPVPGPPLCHPLFHWVSTPKTNQDTRAKPVRSNGCCGHGLCFLSLPGQPPQVPAQGCCWAPFWPGPGPGNGHDALGLPSGASCLAEKTHLDSRGAEEYRVGREGGKGPTSNPPPPDPDPDPDFLGSTLLPWDLWAPSFSSSGFSTTVPPVSLPSTFPLPTWLLYREHPQATASSPHSNPG